MDIEKLLTIKRNDLAPQKGRLLLSEPFLNDFYFGRSVVLLIDHEPDGSFGLIMNKPVNESFNNIVTDFPPFEASVYFGGPVKAESMFILHTLGDLVDGSIEVLNGLFWGGDVEMIKEQVLLGKIQPGQIRFFMGYAGWEPKQLEMELERNAWVVAKTSIGDLLETAHDKMWSKYVAQLGSPYELWDRFPINPEMN